MVEINIIIGGKAGQGINKIARVLSEAFVGCGYYVFNYRDYQSLIRGGHNYNSIKVSDSPIYSHSEEGISFLLMLDEKTYSIHKDKLANDAKIFSPSRIKVEDERIIRIDTDKILKEVNAPKISENLVLVSSLWKYIGLCKESLLESVRKNLKGEFNIKILDIVFSLNEIPKGNVLKCIKSEKKKYYFSGSEGIAYGAIAAGIDAYIAYPMTPSTPVLHILSSVKDKYNIVVYQPENEIAVVNIALGISYAGGKCMIGTSGGGFALMTETLGLQGMSEIPLVIYLAQRYAPATGIPTYTSQGDLKFALNAGHGEFPRVVVAPGDAMEAFRRTIEAIYLAYKYNVLSIIISDKHLAESEYTFDEIEKPKDFVNADRFIDLNPSENYRQYKITEYGVSRRSVPGIKDEILIKATSYEHDEYGFTTEEGEWAIKMSNKRWKKYKYLKEEVKKMEPFKLYNPDADKLIVSWGSTKGAIIDFINKNKEFSFLQVVYIEPFLEDIGKIIESYSEIYLVENNVTGLLGKVITENTGIIIEKKILKYDARPFTVEYLEKNIKR